MEAPRVTLEMSLSSINLLTLLKRMLFFFSAEYLTLTHTHTHASSHGAYALAAAPPLVTEVLACGG